MSIEQIIGKYNYNPELSNFLRSALNSTPVVQSFNVYDYLFKSSKISIEKGGAKDA